MTRGADRAGRSARIFALAAVTVLAVLDMSLSSQSRSAWLSLAFYGVVVLAVALPRGRVGDRVVVGDAVRLAGVCTVSLAETAGTIVAQWPAFKPGEALVLLTALVLGARALAAVTAGIVCALTLVATVALPLRESGFVGDGSDTATVLAAMLVLLFLAAIALVLGLYLRSLDTARVQAVARTRVSERLDMAAELHDFVAHHVTGILAEAQMGSMLVDSDPKRVAEILRHIESAAADALRSMRQTVHLLRDSDGVRGAPRGTDDLVAIDDLIAECDQPVRFTRGDAVTDALPRPIQAAAFRIVREALTNARRHAPAATTVTVALDVVGRALTVEIVNDGAEFSAPAVGSGGFGLVGLQERVSALDGRLDYGPASTHLWTVSASLPLRDRRVR